MTQQATQQSWTPAHMPDLTGHTAVVTGANSGIGFHTALELARRGAHVVMTARDPAKGDEALGQVRVQARTGRTGGGDVRVDLRRLDLADLASVRAFVQELPVDRVDLLVNNAGVMATPRRLTADGFELQLGTNHLGHFALTGLLVPRLLAGSVLEGPARVVTVSSTAHKMGRLDRQDLMGERAYSPWRAYGQSKLANLLFARELQRRAEDAHLRLASLAAHPGYAATNLQARGPQMAANPVGEKVAAVANRLFGQPADRGAWPTLRAATDPQARGGDYFGPSGLGESRGAPRRVATSARALDPDDAAWLWNRSVELTGVDFAALRPA